MKALIQRLVNWMFPVYTQCLRCEQRFDERQRFAFCQRCWAGVQ